MDRKGFIQVLHHFSDSSVEEAQEVVSLKESYPYSQLLHALSARVCKDHGFVNHQQELQMAAVYASDRSALKDIMDAEYEEDQNRSVTITETPAEHTSSFTVYTPKVDTAPQSKDGLADEVIHDLEKLHELRHNFELMFVDTPSDAGVGSIQVKELAETRPVTKEEDKALKEKTGLSKRERIIALAKEADLKAEAESREKTSQNTGTLTRRKKDVGDHLIDEIVSSKKEINPETEKQKEQIDLIDQFIQAQPSISSREKLNTIPAGDLSTIKSGEFGDNIVSETLVDILVKQGKKDKAIEVLKKLIWKFPQKKAYFAAQIEELKK